MSNKFTEEQYQKIVEIGDQYHDDRLKKTEVLLDYMYDDFGFNGGEDTEPLDQALALANPLTREWAHDNFVEKEKKYYWISNKNNAFGLYETDGVVLLKATDWAPLTESEIKAWGYNPEMFDKEEV